MRLRSLDSLRGIAAAAVVLHHVMLMLSDTSSCHLASKLAPLYCTPGRLLVDGPGAVIIFFVLSGLVLAKFLPKEEKTDYISFATRRFTRIWPVFAVAILTSSVLQAVIVYKPLPLMVWFNSTWYDPLGMKVLFDHLAMTGQSVGLDNPMWSLIHEMRISLAFPILAFIVRRHYLVVIAGLSVLTVFVGWLLGKYDFNHVSISLLMTLAFLLPFAVGIYLSDNLEHWRDYLSKRPLPLTAALWTAGLGLIALAPERLDTIKFIRNGLLTLAVTAGAALVVILCAVEGRAFRVLMGKVPAYLGRISYSLYLWHVVILVAVVRLTYGKLPTVVAIGLGVLLSIVVADLSQRFIEVPTTRWGKRLSARRSVNPIAGTRPAGVEDAPHLG